MSGNKQTGNDPYKKLTPQRKMLVDMMLQNLENGAGLWKQSWRGADLPKNAVTGKPYRGVNNLFLTFIAMTRGYTENRWLTFNQMKDRGWHFKTDEEGNSVGKKAGVSVEFFELWDKETRKKFDRSVLDGMNETAQQDYLDKNVYPLRKYYTVFNGDLIDGLPKKERTVLDERMKSERIEKFLDFWDNNESRIIYGGSKAYYGYKKDEIHLPTRWDFHSIQGFYATALHELGHSTGHAKRLNRDLTCEFGSEKYAREELRAEIASLFMEQDFEVFIEKERVCNNSAYIENWIAEIKNDPNVLFTAIADAEKIAKYVSKKESEMNKEVEPYTVIEEENEYGIRVHRVYMTAADGQIRLVPLGEHPDRALVMQEFEGMQRQPYWAEKRFREVSMAELEAESKRRADGKTDNTASSAPITEEPSKVYIPPSVAAAAADMNVMEKSEIRMTGKESLTRMADREIVERAERARDGDLFMRLYNGESVKRTKERDEYALMLRIGLYSDGTEQTLRIFQTSGQYDPNRPAGYYENLARETAEYIAQKRAQFVVAGATKGAAGTHIGINAKS